MIAYSYVVARDFGFAPNPFYGCCSLATCKPHIRKGASVGDWVFGMGSAQRGHKNKLLYAMRVDEKLTYNQYWSDPRFQVKKPLLNGSLKQCYGDNIYCFDDSTEEWYQENSHHSHMDGTPNLENLNRDTKSDKVLISRTFYYFGENVVDIPEDFQSSICHPHIGERKITDEATIEQVAEWLDKEYEPGCNGDPCCFDSDFERYDGVS